MIVAGIIVHEKRIEIRWRDMDNFGHVNNAVYLTYLEEVRDEWVERALGDGRGWDFVLAHVEIDYRKELTQADDVVVARCGLARLGTASVRTREELVTASGELSAEAKAVLVARDRSRGTSRPLTAEERDAFERAP
jgi:acyl-CoA thioester hydrolase